MSLFLWYLPRGHLGTCIPDSSSGGSVFCTWVQLMGVVLRRSHRRPTGLRGEQNDPKKVGRAVNFPFVLDSEVGPPKRVSPVFSG